MSAYYNEFDTGAAAWLRELIKRGLIADGEVDERSILDVTADELRGFAQCHFFAGIGGWSHALRLAGWPDDRQVWTGSPPCQPFSSAGKQLGKDDERHLAPHFAKLIADGRPPIIFGEQVASSAVFGKPASKIKRGAVEAPEWAWIDDLSGRLEAAHYAVAASDIPAASIGAPHIRQRTFFGAVRLEHAEGQRNNGAIWGNERKGLSKTVGPSRTHRLGDTPSSGREAFRADREGYQEAGGCKQAVVPSALIGLADAACVERECVQNIGPAGLRGSNVQPTQCWDGIRDLGTAPLYASTSREIDSPWRDADWIFCRDGKWRPVEPGTFPLAHGVSARVGRLRGYGNAIVPQAAATFIQAFIEAAPC